jgi:pyruvate kinase
MIDLPTNKIRTANLAEPIVFGPGETFTLYDFQFNYPRLCAVARVGDEVIVNNGMNHLIVTDVNERMIEFRADAAGQMGTNRGLIFVREIHTPDFPFFFAKDLELIEVVNDLQVELVGLSFVRYATDKDTARDQIKDPQSLMYKIETRKAFRDYEALFEPGEKILIDRGDLAGEIGLLNIPQAQDRLIRFAHRQRIEVYLATQFLSAMEHSPIPHIAEVCALYETIKLGISGIQLSEETAVGRHPIQAVQCIRQIEHLVAEEGRLRVVG